MKSILIGLLFSQSRADQPVKCPKTGGDVNYVGSTWTFHLTSETSSVNLFEAKEVCTHQLPNKVQIIAEDFNFQLHNQSFYKVKIIDDKNVLAYRCPGHNKNCNFDEAQAEKGTWDILYQQALVVQLDSGLRFISNFKYNIQSGVNGVKEGPAYEQPYNLFERIRDHDFDRFNQHCDKTMIGFVQQANDKQSMQNH